MKKLVGLIVILVVISGIWFGMSRSKKIPTVVKNTNTVPVETIPLFDQTIILTDFTFVPKQFTASPSQTIKVQLNNTGKSAHTLIFDTLDFSSGTIEPGQTTTVTFTVPTKPGNYNFHSAGPDDKEQDMTGTLIVE